MTAKNEQAVAVPGPIVRRFSGIVVRNGRFYWSAALQSAWTAGTVFIILFPIRLLVLRPIYRYEPEWMGVPGLSEPVAGMAAILSVVAAVLVVVSSRGARHRFNAAAPPANGIAVD